MLFFPPCFRLWHFPVILGTNKQILNISENVKSLLFQSNQPPRALHNCKGDLWCKSWQIRYFTVSCDAYLPIQQDQSINRIHILLCELKLSGPAVPLNNWVDLEIYNDAYTRKTTALHGVDFSSPLQQWFVCMFDSLSLHLSWQSWLLINVQLETAQSVNNQFHREPPFLFSMQGLDSFSHHSDLTLFLLSPSHISWLPYTRTQTHFHLSAL